MQDATGKSPSIQTRVTDQVRALIIEGTLESGAALSEIALADETVKKFIEDKPLRKMIFVRGKLVNLVV